MSDAPAVRTELLQLLLDRRSASGFSDVAPTAAQVELMARAAATSPDHGKLRPWRLVYVEGEARDRFGDALVDAGLDRNPELPDPVRSKLRSKAFVAPAFLVIVASPRLESKVDVWEQQATAACAGFGVVLAAEALGLAAVWKSAPFQDGPMLRRLLSMTEAESMLGWVNVGGHPDDRVQVPRPVEDVSERVTVL